MSNNIFLSFLPTDTVPVLRNDTIYMYALLQITSLQLSDKKDWEIK